MALNLKLTTRNQQAIKGTFLPTGDVFYIRASKYKDCGAEVLCDGDRDLFKFNRVKIGKDIELDDCGSIIELDNEVNIGEGEI